MSPRKRNRYRAITVPIGTVVFDRERRIWTLFDRDRYLLDYGAMNRAGWTVYLRDR